MLQRNCLSFTSILFFLSAFLISFAAGAQKTYVPTDWYGHKSVSLAKSITDTLDENFDSATVTIYASPNGGFVSGNSGYNEFAKAQEFDVDSSYTVEGFLYWFGYKKQQSVNADSSFITLTFWKMDSSATISGITRLVPRTVFASTPLLIQDMDTSINFMTGVNVWSVSPTIVYINYAAGFTMQGLDIKDTIALYSSSDEDPPVPTLSWEKWNNVWTPMYYNWGLDIDLAIFPLVDLVTAGLEDEHFFQNLKMNIFPNPASDQLQLEYATEKTGDVDLVIFDANGRAVYHESKGVQPVGTYRYTVDISAFTTGTYYVSLGIDHYKRLTKKLVIR